jgi:hypothetical protein
MAKAAKKKAPRKSPAKLVSGTVDRIEGNTIVVVVQRGDDTEEICVNKKDLQKTDVKPGDKVSVRFP